MPFTKCAPGMGVKPRFVRIDRDDDVECACGQAYPLRRKQLGYDTCLACSREVPKEANVPMHKQSYSYTHDAANLRENCYSTHK